MSLERGVSAPATESVTKGDAKAGDNQPDKKAETRVVAIGDSDFASNAALGVQGNRNLFLNTINWLVQQENLISIRPPRSRRPPNHVDGGSGETRSFSSPS